MYGFCGVSLREGNLAGGEPRGSEGWEDERDLIGAYWGLLESGAEIPHQPNGFAWVFVHT